MQQDSLLGDELRKDIDKGRPYVLLINGREHNVCITQVGFGYVSGFVAINKVLLLIDKKVSGSTVAKVVLPQDEQSAIGPGDELFHSVPVVTASHDLKIKVRIEAIDVFETPWRTFLDDKTVSKDGQILDEGLLLAAMPSLSNYYVKGRGFFRNPDVWSNHAVQSLSELKLTGDEESSSEHGG